MSSAFPDPQDPKQFEDDVVHGLMAAHASESVGATIARVEPRRPRSMQPMSMGPIAAILLMAVTLAVLVPLAISPSAANASDVIGSAEAALAEPGSRTYEIRITRWGGPVASRLMQGEITHVAGGEPRSFGYLELDDSGKRVEFGRDAQGVWFKGLDGQIKRREAKAAEGRSDAKGAAERRSDQAAAGEAGARSDARLAGGMLADVDWMTLDSVLPRLKKGYDLQVVEYPRWKTLIARRQWMPNGIDPKAAAERAESIRQGTQPDSAGREERGAASGAVSGEPRVGQSGGGTARRPNPDVQAAMRTGLVTGGALRGAPLRVELEFAPDGRVIERARIELDAPRAPRTIELRLKTPGEPTADDDIDLGTWE
jgi:hypothetical protein